MSHWQPIETAPLNTNVMVWIPVDFDNYDEAGDEFLMPGYCRIAHNTQWPKESTEQSGWCGLGGWLKASQPPTHWMPLPEPPIAGGGR